jgi:hypothetical protein
MADIFVLCCVRVHEYEYFVHDGYIYLNISWCLVTARYDIPKEEDATEISSDLTVNTYIPLTIYTRRGSRPTFYQN